MHLNASNNLSCEEARFLGESTLNEEAEKIFRYIVIGYLIILFPIAVGLNTALIFLIIRSKRLHKITFYLAANVVIIDLIHILISTPISIVGALKNRWVLGLGMCRLTAAILSFIFIYRFLLMFILVCDRFCTVFFPFKYRRKKVVAVMISGLITFISIEVTVELILDCADYNRTFFFCYPQSGCANPYVCEPLTTAMQQIVVIIGTVGPIVMYIALFIKARKLANQVASTEGMPIQEIQNHRKREKRATKIFLFLFLTTFCIILLPLLIGSVLFNIVLSLQMETVDQWIAVVWVVVRMFTDLIVIVDPITIMRNMDVRKSMLRVFNRTKSFNTTTNSIRSNRT